MNRKMLLLMLVFVLLLAVLAGGVSWYLKVLQKDAAEVLQKQSEEDQVAQKEQQESDNLSVKTYKNTEYGFELSFPGDLDLEKLIVQKKVLKKEDSFHSANEIILFFGYPLDKPVLRVEKDPGLGYIESMDLWYMSIIPTEDWKENACADDDTPLCRQVGVLARNDAYVFESGTLSVEGAGHLCAYEKKEQVNFCTIFDKFSDFVISGEFFREERRY